MRSSTRLLTLAGIVAAALVGALVAAVVLWRMDDAAVEPFPEAVAEIEAETRVVPRTALFGDSVRAQVDVVLDETRVDPASVQVAADFDPFAVVGSPRTERRDAGDSVHLRTTYVLRCVSGACVPSAQSEEFEFPPVRVTYATPSEQDVSESSTSAGWQSVLLYSRFASEGVGADDVAQPWQADLVSLPAVSYRRPPELLVAALLTAAALLVLAGAGLAYLAWPRREPAPAPEPEPEPEPVALLSPLEQALVLLEQSIRVDGAAGQRRALELVAEELELAEWGDRELARTARTLAWSEEPPPIEQTTSLAARVRTSLPAPEEPSLNGDGGAAA